MSEASTWLLCQLDGAEGEALEWMGMQQSNEAPAEPSMEDILASIRKIISEEPAAAKQNTSARPPVKQPLNSQGASAAASTPSSMASPPQSNASAPSRLSDIVRELAPTAVPVSSISTASFHDDMADLVEGGASSAAPSMKIAEASFKTSAPAANTFRPVAPAEPVVPVVAEKPAPRPEPVAPAPMAKAAPNIPAPILAPSSSGAAAAMPQKPAADFGAFIPSSAESIGMTSPRPLPISLGSEFRNVEPVRAPAPARVVKPDPQPTVPEVTESLNRSGPASDNDDSDMASAGDSDPVAAAQSALGALAMGFATPASVPATTSVSTVTPAPTEVAVHASEMPAALETGRKSLDDSIVDMLRPMLRDWLDSHLPEMVEKALTQELRDRRN
jgi:uncharacterized protein